MTSFTAATVRAGQTAVHAVGVLRVRLAVLAGKTDPLFLVPLAFLVHKGSCTHTPDTNPVRTRRELRDGTSSSSSHHCHVLPVFSKKIVRIFGQTFSRLHGFGGLEIELIKQLLGYFLGPDKGIL